jgi:transcriptional regulator with XRE-family HTH domain
MNIPLKIAVVESGKSQIEIARLLCISEAKFSRFVRGHDMPSEAEMRAIAKVLRKPVAQVFPQAQCA